MARRIRVYRVELDDGSGPYEDGYAPLEPMYNEHRGESWPTPIADGIGWDEFTSDHVCAFASTADLAAWFGKWRPVLASLGFRCSVYLVPASAVLAGRRQVMFLRDVAERVGVEPLV
jgi:hypothetical protein